MACLWFPLDASSRRRGWECCQCGSVASSNVANSQFGIEIGSRGSMARGETVWYTMRRKGKLTWRQNADIAVRRATGMDARTAQTEFTSTGTTRNTANGAVHRATGTDARMVRIGFTGTALAATSASGAARRPTARAAPTPRRVAMRSDGRPAQAYLTR